MEEIKKIVLNDEPQENGNDVKDEGGLRLPPTGSGSGSGGNQQVGSGFFSGPCGTFTKNNYSWNISCYFYWDAFSFFSGDEGDDLSGDRSFTFTIGNINVTYSPTSPENIVNGKKYIPWVCNFVRGSFVVSGSGSIMFTIDNSAMLRGSWEQQDEYGNWVPGGLDTFYGSITATLSYNYNSSDREITITGVSITTNM
ncbi:MAG: hypothetical protein J5678_00225 [Bacteroidaceae bacterium]|nr:hypothetical protein [Bacteroidaceae bacterium]